MFGYLGFPQHLPLAAFDSFCHLRKGDVSILIHLRWAKTLQKYQQSIRFRLFAIPGRSICPLATFISLQRSDPVLASVLAFLSYRASGRQYIICQSNLYRYFKRLVTTLASFFSHFRGLGRLWRSRPVSFRCMVPRPTT
jgi:hypothetical protein